LTTGEENIDVYSRRDFGRIALASLPLAAAHAARINSRVNGVQVGAIDYCWRDRPLDACIKGMIEAGVGECELIQAHTEPGGIQPPQAAGARSGPDPSARETLRKWRLTVPLAEFKAIRKKFDDAGILLTAYNVGFANDYTDEEIDRGFQMAQALGVKTITSSTTLSVVKRAVPFAEKYKIMVAVHGHSNIKDPNQFSTPESFEQAMAMSKYFGVNLDIGHFFAAGFDPVAYIQAHHDRIPEIHLKDRKKNQGANVPWGEGDTPIKEVLQLLKVKRYPIRAYIEYEYRGTEDATIEVKKCMEYIRKCLA
jgi:sugar phosphate isomerase/epimerase